jgi:mRNA interferase MazF
MKRGEVWLVDFDPALGDEIRKTRPAVVLSSDMLGKLRLKVVVPITSWQDKFADNSWMVLLVSTAKNGLMNDSVADTLQVQSVAHERFQKRLGMVEPQILDEILEALAVLLEFPF